jgi:fructosamine-3-kinase
MSFRKQSVDVPPGFFACEAAGLAWLAVPGGPRVVRVLDVSASHLELERLQPVAPSRDAARAFGKALARMHDAGADAFGAPPREWRETASSGRLTSRCP